MHAAAKDRATRKRLGALLTTLIRNSSPYADLPGRGDSLRIAARQRQEAYFIGSGDMEGDWERAGKILRDRVELLIFPHEYTIDLARALPKEGSLAFRRFPWFYQNLMRQTIQALRAQTWFTRVTLVDRNAECSLIFHGVAEFGHTNSAQILI